MDDGTLRPPPDARRRADMILRAVVTLAALELVIRRRTLPELCGWARIGFGAFQAPEEAEVRLPLPLHVAHAWWAIEAVLSWWPWGRGRQCLRRSLVLGRQTSYLDPVLVLEPASLEPFLVHAVLVTRGHRLDLGAVAA